MACGFSWKSANRRLHDPGRFTLPALDPAPARIARPLVGSALVVVGHSAGFLALFMCHGAGTGAFSTRRSRRIGDCSL